MYFRHSRNLQKKVIQGNRGLSLLEVLFAAFLLVTALALMVYLIDASFRSEADSGVRIKALHEAQNVMAEIESTAQSDFRGGIGAVDGRVWPSNNADYIIESRAEWGTLPLPCTELEEQYDPGVALPSLARKELTQSVWRVQVEVRRSRDNDRILALDTLISDLRPEPFVVRLLSPDGVVAPPEGELTFRAVAYGAGNEVIEDLILTWYVEPLNSFGSIHQVRRDGWECVYKNQYQDYGRRMTTTPGVCRIVVRGEYKGRVETAILEITNQ